MAEGHFVGQCYFYIVLYLYRNTLANRTLGKEALNTDKVYFEVVWCAWVTQKKITPSAIGCILSTYRKPLSTYVLCCNSLHRAVRSSLPYYNIYYFHKKLLDYEERGVVLVLEWKVLLRYFTSIYIERQTPTQTEQDKKKKSPDSQKLKNFNHRFQP